MTMHLMSHAYDTVRRGRGKTAKITKRDHERLTREWQDYNRYACLLYTSPSPRD